MVILISTNMKGNVFMKLQALVLSITLLFFSVFVVDGQAGSNKVIDSILSSYSTRTFSDKPVGDNEIEQIVKCGIKAPSARNSQPWKFTVVKDISKVQGIFRSINKGNVVIIVSGLKAEQEGINVDFDCALATENMYIAAQSMGLGARVYTGPIRNIDNKMKEALEIPDSYRIVALLRIGNLDDSTDAISSASSRNDIKDMVNYIE
jgi:nitroreductase